MLSDHSAIHVTMAASKPKLLRNTILCRKYRSIDLTNFSYDLSSSPLLQSPKESLDELVCQYDSVIKKVVNKHAPLVSKTVVIRPYMPWYDTTILQAKRNRRQLERKWRHTKLPSDRVRFKGQRETVNKLIDQAKADYYRQKIAESAGDQSSLFKIVDSLLHRKAKQVFPANQSHDDLAKGFGEYFVSKISTIRQNLDEAGSNEPEGLPSVPKFMGAALDTFRPANNDEIRSIIMKSSNAFSSLDPLPTWLLKANLDILLPCITNLVNKSLESGVVPTEFKKAIVKPLLKKKGLDPENLKNVRPVSNLTFVSKVIEKVVASRLHEHINAYKLHEEMQSAYRKFHSTETALLRVHNDIMLAVDRGSAVVLVLLDLSAPFDTIDHDILLQRVHKRIGVTGTALQWFKSYLTNRCQQVLIEDAVSSSFDLLFGVPQD